MQILNEPLECPYGDPDHTEDENGRIYCNACHDAKMPEWEGEEYLMEKAEYYRDTDANSRR